MGWDADTHRSIRLEGACSRNRRHRQISNSQFTYWLFWAWCLWAWSDSACMAAYTAQSDTVTPSAASRCDHMLCRPGWKHSPKASEIWAGRCSPWNSHVSHFYLNPTFDQDSLSSWVSTLIWKHITVLAEGLVSQVALDPRRFVPLRWPVAVRQWRNSITYLGQETLKVCFTLCSWWPSRNTQRNRQASGFFQRSRLAVVAIHLVLAYLGEDLLLAVHLSNAF